MVRGGGGDIMRLLPNFDILNAAENRPQVVKVEENNFTISRDDYIYIIYVGFYIL